jgi:hypothetical protein
MTARRKWRLLLLTGVLGLVASEIGLRIYAKLTHHERGLVFDSRWGWRMESGLTKTGFMWGGAKPSRTNSHGWRDAETSYEKPAGIRRIVALGDSFTFGVGVDDAERYTEVLESMTGGLEVLNLGMNAVGTDQELLYLETEGVRYSPDIVLCALFEGNDFTDVSYDRNSFWPKPYFRLEEDRLVEVPPARSWDVRLRMCGYLGEALYRVVQRWTAYRVVAPEWKDRDTLPLLVALLTRMNADAEKAGAHFAVFLIRSNDRPGAADSLAAALAPTGITVLDPGPRLDDPSLHIPEDGHWNAAGHRATAEFLAERFRMLGWL